MKNSLIFCAMAAGMAATALATKDAAAPAVFLCTTNDAVAAGYTLGANATNRYVCVTGVLHRQVPDAWTNAEPNTIQSIFAHPGTNVAWNASQQRFSAGTNDFYFTRQ